MKAIEVTIVIHQQDLGKLEYKEVFRDTPKDVRYTNDPVYNQFMDRKYTAASRVEQYKSTLRERGYSKEHLWYPPHTIQRITTRELD